MKIREYTGNTSSKVQPYEIENRIVSKKAAIAGMVLLKNENNILPLRKNSTIALYGGGAVKTIKGGTGSGDVNVRDIVSIYDGLKNAGFTITTEDWVADYRNLYTVARKDWKNEIWRKIDESKNPYAMFNIYSSIPFVLPCGSMATKTETETAIYVHSRLAGENKDTSAQKGDYYLSDEEDLLLSEICSLYKNVIVLLNTGAPIDLSFLDKYKNIYGLLNISQPGMEAGNAVAEILNGAASPSGKLTDTWAINYEDYPNSKTFSHNNGNISYEIYEEGIYVGYRYFDTFSKKARYNFGFGLSYATFSIERANVKKTNSGIKIGNKVVNTSDRFSGREVVEVYASCPTGKLAKEYRRLVGFAKTKVLMPGESQNIEIEFTANELSSFSEYKCCWLLESGVYGIFVGNSLESSVIAGSINICNEIILEKTCHVCPLEQTINELKAPLASIIDMRDKWIPKLINYPSIELTEHDIKFRENIYGKSNEKIDEDVLAFVDKLSVEQLINFSMGEMGQDAGSNLGSAGISVPGSAAQTSSCAFDMGIPSLVLADGPAGLRLTKEYTVKDGNLIRPNFEEGFENGLFSRNAPVDVGGQKWYQLCTAMPVGTLLAQTWDVEEVKKVGEAVAREMNIFNVNLWLAPGMNIHRNPLCGRNFEYFSEDPFLVGKIAAALTKSVQSIDGCGTTIKHLALNNQEDNRIHSNSIVSERTFREIYLKGFEIAVKEAQPLSIMTSYNLINGIHAANNFDLCTKIVRDEWNFDGVIMTDWTTTNVGADCTAAGCVKAGNELVMPGFKSDYENIKTSLDNGAISINELKNNIAHLISVIKRVDGEVCSNITSSLE
jgi:beta-glucosidase